MAKPIVALEKESSVAVIQNSEGEDGKKTAKESNTEEAQDEGRKEEAQDEGRKEEAQEEGRKEEAQEEGRKEEAQEEGRKEEKIKREGKLQKVLYLVTEKVGPKIADKIKRNLEKKMQLPPFSTAEKSKAKKETQEEDMLFDEWIKLLQWYAGVSKEEKELVKKETLGESSKEDSSKKVTDVRKKKDASEKGLDLDSRIIEVIKLGDIKKIKTVHTIFNGFLKDLGKKKNKKSGAKNKKYNDLWDFYENDYYDYNDGYSEGYDDTEALDLEYSLDEDDFGVHHMVFPDSAHPNSA